jgi:hypothetical protein
VVPATMAVLHVWPASDALTILVIRKRRLSPTQYGPTRASKTGCNWETGVGRGCMNPGAVRIRASSGGEKWVFRDDARKVRRIIHAYTFPRT